MSSEYERGFEAGYMAAAQQYLYGGPNADVDKMTARMLSPKTMVKKRKKPQTGKAKLLTTMTKKKWDKYKKGNGKKTYVEIRALVSKSQDYKRACKRKGFK